MNALTLRASSALLLSAIVCLISGCDPRADDLDARPGVPVETMVDQALHPQPGQDYPPFLDELREPERTEIDVVENRHIRSQMDTVRTFVYAGLHIEVYDPSHDDRRLVRRISVEESGYEHGLAFDIGDPESIVREVRGEPEEAVEGELRYRLRTGDAPPAGPPNYLHVRIRDGEVDRISWNFYVG